MIQVAPYTFIAVTHPLPSPYIYIYCKHG